MKPVKTTAAALLFAFVAQTALAGGMAEPVTEPVMAPAVVEQQTSSSAQGLIVPLLLLVVLAAAVSN